MSLTNLIEAPFTGIDKTDTRWYNQPEQIANLTDGHPNFAFGAEVTNVLNSPGQYDMITISLATNTIDVATDLRHEFFDNRIVTISGSDFNDGDYLVSIVEYNGAADRTILTLVDALTYSDTTGRITTLTRNVIQLPSPCDGVAISYDMSRGRSIKKLVKVIPDYSGVVTISTFDPLLPASAKWDLGNFKYTPNTGSIRVYVNGVEYSNITETDVETINIVYYPPPPLEVVDTLTTVNGFTILKDYTAEMIDGVRFNLVQTTNAINDGSYVVKSSSYDSTTNVTTILVYEDITAQPLADGEIVDIEITIEIRAFGGTLQEVSDNTLIGFKRINTSIIELIGVNYGALGDVVITMLNPSTTKHNPIKLIDKQSKVVTSDISLWDPKRGQHYQVSNQIVDVKSNYDPAIYEFALDGVTYDVSMLNESVVNRVWNEGEVAKVWWNDNNLSYVPYHDNVVFPSIHDRIHHWGKKADWSDILLYEWTESDTNPNDEWTGDGNILSNTYKRTRTIGPIGPWTDWIKLEQIVEEQFAAINLYANPIWNYTDFELTTIYSTTVSVFVNRLLVESQSVDVSGNVVLTTAVQEQDIVSFVEDVYIPTTEELDFDPDVADDVLIDTQYKKHTPYGIRTSMLSDKSDSIKYYFWVSDIADRTNGRAISLRNAASNFVQTPDPFAQLDHFLPSQLGKDSSNVSMIIPDRFSKITIQGLRGFVNEYERYVIRITSDYSLRDNVRDDIKNEGDILKNKHTEWKLFREQQTSNIPQVLWNKVTEAMLGFSLTDSAKAIPSLDRVLYDQKNDTSTRFGTNSGQAITDKDLAIQTIKLIVLDPDYDITPVDKNTFLESVFDVDTDIGIRTTMEYIYNSFNTAQVNELFFSLLFDGLTLKSEMTGLFKTSWISMQSTIILDVNGRLSNG